ncbi:winged helix-turn-helix transcriptional regulator [Candidatus Micrarchaeota archaeon]|nr:winged helix-turn-helix transcriptional regulator [Candidatus Micrarchaeota archaeon]
MDIRKQALVGMTIVSVFVFLVTVLVVVFSLYSQGQEVPDLLKPFLAYHVQFMIVMGLFGVGSGLALYTILNSTLEKQKQIVKTNSQIIMKFLAKDEREVVSLLLSKDGRTTQSEIASLPNMSRLKAHRIVKKLEGQGIVHVEKYGKINMIRIIDELMELEN